MDKKKVKSVFVFGLLTGLALFFLLINPHLGREQTAALSRTSKIITITGTDFVLTDQEYGNLKMLSFMCLTFGFLGIFLLSIFDRSKVKS